MYLNIKPWVTKYLKNVLERKHRAFLEGSETEKREARGEVRAEIKKAKFQHENMLKEHLSSNNMKAACKRMRKKEKAHYNTANKPELLCMRAIKNSLKH